MVLKIDWKDFENIGKFRRAIEKLTEAELRKALVPALNRTGDMARTQVRKRLVVQTGLKRRVIIAAVHTWSADSGKLEYTLTGSGGDVSLMHFSPRETLRGVSAQPWGRRTIFDGTFRRAGWWPDRRTKLNWNGQVFATNGDKTETGMDEFEKQKSGVFIPKEMVKGATADAFRKSAERNLPRRVVHEIKRATKGVIS